MTYPRMLILTWSLAILLACLLAYDMAHAQRYLEGAAGLTLPLYVHDHAYDVSGAPVSPTGLNKQTTMGGAFAFRAGAYREIWGFELEAMRVQPNIQQDKIFSCDQQPSGDCTNGRTSLIAGRMHSVMSVALHGLMRHEGERWDFFGGIGPALFWSKLGGDSCGWKPPQCGTVLSPYTDSTRNANALGVSAKIGTLYKVTDTWGITMTYGIQYAKFIYDGWVPQADATGHAETIKYVNHLVTVGGRYTF